MHNYWSSLLRSFKLPLLCDCGCQDPVQERETTPGIWNKSTNMRNWVFSIDQRGIEVGELPSKSHTLNILLSCYNFLHGSSAKVKNYICFLSIVFSHQAYMHMYMKIKVQHRSKILWGNVILLLMVNTVCHGAAVNRGQNLTSAALSRDHRLIVSTLCQLSPLSNSRNT